MRKFCSLIVSFVLALSVLFAFPQTEARAAETGSAGNVLVVYFSATGNTQRAAEAIAEQTGGTLFEIEPQEPYTQADLDWNDSDSRVNQEHENTSLRDIALTVSTPENWSSYDTVFIGYPIWWGIAAWPVSSFVRANDFTGKTVIPFCTSSSSGIGESGNLLRDLAGTGNWLSGHRFSSGVSSDDVEEWLSGLNLSFGSGSVSAGWVLDQTGWWYRNADGSYPAESWQQIDGVWYYFLPSGYMVSNDWVLWNGSWYYETSSGAMLAGNWVQWKGLWYYLGSDGAMLTDTRTPDGYFVNADGVWVP